MEQAKARLIRHEFPPVWNSRSRILILGSFPSVKSREEGFYYGNPRNRFWDTLAGVLGAETPLTIEEKKEFLLSRGIAIWDVIAECEITGSSDSSIRNVTPADIGALLSKTDIRAIYANGGTAAKLYEKYCEPVTRRGIRRLPSTSPANAAYSLERLKTNWREIVCMMS